MNIFSLNKLEITDLLYDSLIGTNQNYVNTLSDWQKRKYRKLRELFELDRGKLFVYIKSKSANLRNKKVEVVAPKNRDEVLKKMYENPETTKNGRDSFYHHILNSYANIPRRYVQKWLEKQENYQLHLLQPREKVLRPISDKKINSKWQIDLIDMQKYGKSPQNHRRAWLFVAIDVFSKFAYIRAITQKTAIKAGEALERILQNNFMRTGAYPRVIQTDNGKEFVNKIFKDIC